MNVFDIYLFTQIARTLKCYMRPTHEMISTTTKFMIMGVVISVVLLTVLHVSFLDRLGGGVIVSREVSKSTVKPTLKFHIHHSMRSCDEFVHRVDRVDHVAKVESPNLRQVTTTIGTWLSMNHFLVIC